MDLIRILDGSNDIDVELCTFVKDVFVYTMELLGFYRHIEESAKLPRARYYTNTNILAQHFRNMVKKDEIKSKPGYRDVLVTSIFPELERRTMLYSKGIADDTLAIAPKDVSDSNFHKSKEAQMQNDPGGPTSSRGHPEDIK